MTIEPKRILIPMFTHKKNGLDRPIWLGMLRDYGCEVDAPDAAIYCGVMPRKPASGPVTLEMMSWVSNALRKVRSARALGNIGCIVVPHFGHFGSREVWAAAAEKLVELGGLVIDVSAHKELDGRDVTAGDALLKRSRARVASAGQKLSGSRTGRKKIPLGGKRLDEALALFPNPDWTIGDLVKKFGFSNNMTFLRRIEDATGTQSKGLARYLADRGEWPPTRKLSAAFVEELKAKAGLF